jgi:hypothetical protein
MQCWSTFSPSQKTVTPCSETEPQHTTSTWDQSKDPEQSFFSIDGTDGYTLSMCRAELDCNAEFGVYYLPYINTSLVEMTCVSYQTWVNEVCKWHFSQYNKSASYFTSIIWGLPYAATSILILLRVL